LAVENDGGDPMALTRTYGRWLMAFVAASCVASSARADSSQDKAVAEALFRDAKQLLESGDVAGACPKFAESLKVDSTLGTLLFLAACHEQQGRTASAWSEFSSALSWSERTGQAERIAFAHKHLAALENRLSFVVIHAPALAGLQLKVDDELLSAAAIGTPLPLDPGTHSFEASAPNRGVWRTVIGVRTEPERIPIDVPELPPAPTAPAATVAPTPPPAVVVPRDEPKPPAAHPSDSGRRAALWTALATTAAGVAVGSVFGVLTFQARDSARLACPGNVCRPGGLDDINRAHTDATVSTVGFGVGVAAALVAAYFAFKGHPADTAASLASTPLGTVSLEPTISSHQATVSMGMRFE
jgi:hypothetical protein